MKNRLKMDCSALPARCAGVGAGRMSDWSGLESGMTASRIWLIVVILATCAVSVWLGAAERKGMRKAWA